MSGRIVSRPSRTVGALSPLACLLLAAGALAGEAAPPAGDNGAAGRVRQGLVLATTSSADRPVEVLKEDGKPFDVSYKLTLKGLALHARHYSLRLEGGAFRAERIEKHLSAAFNKSGGQMSLGACLSPAGLAQEGAQIVWFGPEGGRRQFALVQEGKEVLLSIRTSEGNKPVAFKLHGLAEAKPVHLLVTVSPEAVVAYADGREVARHPGIKGDFSNWEPGLLVFGNDDTGESPWKGRIDRLTLHRRALKADEARALAESVGAEMKKLSSLPPLRLKATLLRKSAYAAPRTITYRSVMAVYEYRVEQVLAGKYEEKEIRVAHWMYIDFILLTNTQREAGKSYELAVEPMKFNAQVGNITEYDSLKKANNEDLDMEKFYDCGPIEPLPAKKEVPPGEGEKPAGPAE